MPKPNFSETDRIIHEVEAQSRASQQVVRDILMEEGRWDLVAEFDRNMRDLETGVTRARNVWHSISPAQREVITLLAGGPTSLKRSPRSTTYDIVSPLGSQYVGIRLATVRALAAREMLDWTGGAFDPEQAAVLNEFGRFVVSKGQPETKKAPPA